MSFNSVTEFFSIVSPIPLIPINGYQKSYLQIPPLHKRFFYHKYQELEAPYVNLADNLIHWQML